jgi:hypothetical protein
MNNLCICWFFTHIFTGILIFKEITVQRLYQSFGVKAGLPRLSAAKRAKSSVAMQHCNVSGFRFQLYTLQISNFVFN